MYWETTGIFETNGETFYFALFHAVSAFNNAGFSLWTDGLMDTAVVNSHFPQVIIMLLVFIGSIGFVVLRDFFAPAVIRERKRKRWKSLTMGTQIALITSFVIIAVGTVLFFFMEYDNTLANRSSLFDKMFTALFQVTADVDGGHTDHLHRGITGFHGRRHQDHHRLRNHQVAFCHHQRKEQN